MIRPIIFAKAMGALLLLGGCSAPHVAIWPGEPPPRKKVLLQKLETIRIQRLDLKDLRVDKAVARLEAAARAADPDFAAHPDF